jgi:hypothetical protein
MDEKKLDSIVSEFYKNCYDSALELLQKCSEEEILYLGLLKRSDYRTVLDDYDDEIFTSEEAFNLVLDKSATDAFIAAACTVINGLHNDQNQSIN